MAVKNTFMSKLDQRYHEAVARADTARDNKCWLDAARLYAAALKLRADDEAIWVQYGHALKELGEYTEAEEAYLHAIRMKPLADSYLQLGHLHNLLQRTQNAEENYLRALEIDGGLLDAKNELVRLGWSAAKLGVSSAKDQQVRLPDDAPRTAGPCIAFELSDLIDFLQHARYPTGIQRVQMELAEVLQTGGAEISFVYFDNGDFVFKEISRIKIRQVVDLLSDASRPEATRSEVASRLKSDIRSGAPFAFPERCTLVNVGTSWGYHNYFMALREMKRRYGLRYAPLVHDTIPLLFPEYCDQNLVADFINWIDGIAEHADLVLANSRNTLKDVGSVFATLQKQLPPSGLLLLNGEFRKNPSGDIAAQDKADQLLRAHHLDTDDYVLMVSTLEPRKNHALALNAWSAMLSASEARVVPYLVFVGAPGWLNDALYTRLARDEKLAERVIILTNVSDQELNKLYGRALFTIFPSSTKAGACPSRKRSRTARFLWFRMSPLIPRPEANMRSTLISTRSETFGRSLKP